MSPPNPRTHPTTALARTRVASLLQTAILERLNASLCDTLMGQGGSQIILERLERDNLFLVPLDDERHWYRYHHLFAELLQARLQQSMEVNEIAHLHVHASLWYEEHNWIDEAARHALAARDFGRTARLIEQAAITMFARGEFTTLLTWIDSFPGELARGYPWLCIYHAWALAVTGRLDGVEELLQCAEQYVQADVPAAEIRDMTGRIAIIRAQVANVGGDIPCTIEQSQRALEYLPESDPIMRTIASFPLGRVYLMSGDLVSAAQVWSDAARLGRETDRADAVVSALCELAGLCKVQGRLCQANDLYQEALQLAIARDRPFRLMAPIDIGLSDLLREWNDLDRAIGHAVDGIESYKRWGSPNAIALGYATMARALQSQGDCDGASRVLEKAEQLVWKHSVYPEVRSAIDARRVCLSLAQGDSTAIAHWIKEHSIREDDSPSFSQELEHIALARVFVAWEESDRALGLLDRLAEAAELGGRYGRLIEILVLQAVALFGLAGKAQNGTDRALAKLTRALSLSQTEGYARVFVDEGQPLVVLIKLGLERSVWADPLIVAYVHRLLDAFGSDVKDLQLTMVDKLPLASGSLPLVEPLSDRELEVLRLMASGLSNQEIADRLVLALGTVKAHLHNAYGKLGVRGRTQAIARAMDLDLL